MYVYCATESIGPVIEQKSADTLVESVPHETKYLLTATSSVCVCVCVFVCVCESNLNSRNSRPHLDH